MRSILSYPLPKIMMIYLMFCPPLLAAERTVTWADIQALEAQLKELKARFLKQNPNVLDIKSPKPSVSASTQKNHSQVDVYATIRPTFGIIDEQSYSYWDVRDALSHAGIKAATEFATGWSAQLHGEWSIDLANQGNFGKSRRVYTAISTPFGRFGIGKQRPPQYLFIAEYVDIFNHASSPFAYDPQSIFFVDNLISYRLDSDPFTFIAVGQYAGDTDDNQTDLFNVGVSYDVNGLHAALTYQQNDVHVEKVYLGENRVWATSLAYQFNPRLYGAISYQAKDYRRVAVSETRKGHTIDFSMAYQLATDYKLKTGFFEFNDGYHFDDTSNQSFDGFNITLEWLPTPPLRVHLEYLNKSYFYRSDIESFSVGLRYDFKRHWQFN
ncbi:MULTISPECIES: porin [Pseudoalteromonas]|uniref:Porin n=1 Tax=Pseudoalteromonas amylolytica TaxID=1859457 RepID=A0A1S1MTQ9_9GAMM|nr:MULTISPECIES: porin [Pseudoalteromonas]OHU85025.1 porin [Pseudoalteromonas sp. JW3]OHU90024.1 porin [Pseudoalteromonas amylolytica]